MLRQPQTCACDLCSHFSVGRPALHPPRRAWLTVHLKVSVVRVRGAHSDFLPPNWVCRSYGVLRRVLRTSVGRLIFLTDLEGQREQGRPWVQGLTLSPCIRLVFLKEKTCNVSSRRSLFVLPGLGFSGHAASTPRLLRKVDCIIFWGAGLLPDVIFTAQLRVPEVPLSVPLCVCVWVGGWGGSKNPGRGIGLLRVPLFPNIKRNSPLGNKTVMLETQKKNVSP